jgi:hypothetical protein
MHETGTAAAMFLGGSPMSTIGRGMTRVNV